MSRTQADQVIDEEESETCPLCIEEMDLQDRHYKPCPCGYQICFFCYNNIKKTMNGLCPACRRPYDEVPVFDEPSAEEIAQDRERQVAQNKRKAAAKQKEAQKREADTLSRKHLAGIRVRQKNLVYVTGMRPNISDSQLSELLRQDEYFGQYGKIVKVVVSKAKENHPNNSVGVYVTFARKEDAERCIQMVDGSENIDGRLRAQYGTTKYCSSYIRGETCTNRQCMFLHEPGEENESFTRQDLSSLNVASTQSPTQANTESTEPQPQPPSQQAPVAAASTPVEQKIIKEAETTQLESPERPALPSSASWANRVPHTQSANRSSEMSNASLVSQIVETSKVEPSSSATDSPSVAASLSIPNVEEPPESSQPATQLRTENDPSRQLLGEIKTVVSNEMEFVFDEDALEPRILQLVKAFPALFDANGGAKRQILKQSEVELHHQQTDNQVARQTLSAIELDENAEGGSLQLGGEPEDRHDLSVEQQRHAIQPPAQDNVSNQMFGLDHPFSSNSTSDTPSVRGTMLPQQQQQQYLLQQFKSASPGFPSQTQTAHSGYTNTQSVGQGHSRQTSRFSFANDTSASTSVKPVTDRKMMNQQSAMMPPQQSGQYSQYSQQQQGNKFFSSGVQGPPPGLKATGTPPVSGGGMFGQGHGFATAGLGYGVNATRRNPNDEMLHDLIRARGGSAGSGQTSDNGRREYMFSSPFLHNTSSQSSTPAPAPGISSFPYGPHPGAFQDHGPQKQKKKGKKHRHANTSSSGGGVVDLADPSILQARMHPAGSSGLYGNQGGQGQDDLPFFGQPAVPSLSTGGYIRAAPSVPPGFLQTSSAFVSSRPSDEGSVELFGGDIPGLGINNHSEAPVSPSLNASSHKPEPKFTQKLELTAEKNAVILETPKQNVLDEEAFPALPSSSAGSKKATKQAEPIDSTSTKDLRSVQSKAGKDKRLDTKTPIEPGKTKSVKSSIERQHPAKLDIADAKAEGLLAESKPQERTRATPTLQPGEESSAPASETSRSGTPSETAETSSKRAAQPKTIRVVPTPKTETPPINPPPQVVAAHPPRSTSAIGKRPSRQASIASSSNTPATPVSEKVSDTVPTDAASQIHSPQPDKSSPASIPTAPNPRPKGHAKKEKAERAKGDDKKVDSVTASENVVHEPIIGRKKKTKKPGAPASGTATSTPTISRPPSPVRDNAKVEEPPEEYSEEEESRPQSPTTSKDASISNILAGLNFDGGNNRLRKSSLFHVPITGVLDSSAESQTTPLGAETTSHPHAHLVHPLTLTEHATLDAGTPVRRGSENGPHLLISPSRFTVLFDATPEAESRYLELEKRLLESPEHLRYNHRWAGQEASSMLRIFGLQAMALTEMAGMIMRPPTTVMAAAGADKRAGADVHGGWKSRAYTYTHGGGPAEEQVLQASGDVNQDNEIEASHSGSDSDEDRDEEEGQTDKRQHGTQSAPPPKLQPAPPQQQPYASDALAYIDQFILPLPTQPVTGPFAYGAAHGINGLFPTTSANSTVGNFPPNHVSNLPANHPANNTSNTISTPIPRLYTTGDPTYSVSAVDFNTTAMPSRERPYEGLSSRYYHPAANVGSQKFQGKNVNVTEEGGECRGIEEAIATAKWDYERLTEGMRDLVEKNKSLVGFGRGNGEVEVR